MLGAGYHNFKETVLGELNNKIFSPGRLVSTVDDEGVRLVHVYSLIPEVKLTNLCVHTLPSHEEKGLGDFLSVLSQQFEFEEATK